MIVVCRVQCLGSSEEVLQLLVLQACEDCEIEDRITEPSSDNHHDFQPDIITERKQPNNPKPVKESMPLYKHSKLDRANR